MIVNVENNLVRVVILYIGGLYTQIYDELYCSQERYNEIVTEFHDSGKYKVVVI